MNGIGSGDAIDRGGSPPLDEKKRSAVSGELGRIVESEAFRTSRRSREFLSYVVQQTLEGKGELLKERTIGVDVFQRAPEGITTENSVVRKQAGEVRKRLEHYYKDAADDFLVQIQLPLGSYVPEFWFHLASPADSEATVLQSSERTSAPSAREDAKTRNAPDRIRRLMVAVAVLLIAALCAGTWAVRRHEDKYPLFTRFWEPVSTTPESVVVCLAKPVVYIPSREYFQKYSNSHGRNAGPEWQRLNEPLPKDTDVPPTWSDMRYQEDYGIARGDAYAAFRMATLFSQLGKSSQLRIGDDCSLADLRSAPVTLIGAYNNRWTMQMSSSLHFRFSEDQGNVAIKEQTPAGRVWKPEWNSSARSSSLNAAPGPQPSIDFALVSRLKNSETGQYLTIVAGMTGPGTQAAAEFVSSPQDLDPALRRIAPGWESRNLQMILRVASPNGITPTSPQVVATTIW
jgi:hypothetical protein